MRLLVMLLFLCSCMGPTAAGAAVRESDPGDASGRYLLGVKYVNAAESAGDFAEAAHWYGLAADEGHARAQRNLGTLYDCGLGVGPDIARAAQLYILAAEQGDLGALLAVANMHGTGRGAFAYPWRRQLALAAVMEQMLAASNDDHWDLYRLSGEAAQDDAKLAEFVERCAKTDYPAAQSALGMLYETGLGVGRDTEKAVAWFERAAESGDIEAQNRLGMLYREGRYGLEENHRLAFDWFTKAADQGHPAANLEVAKYHFALGNYDRAYENFAAAAEAGSVYAAEAGSVYAAERTALLLLGSRLYEPAVEWGGKAAEMGGTNAHLVLFVLQAAGLGGLEQDMPRALERLRDGLTPGASWTEPGEQILPYIGEEGKHRGITIDFPSVFPDSTAGHLLKGLLYQYGVQTAKDPARAMEQYMLAARDGEACAQYLAARLYERDSHFAPERELCVEWFEKAAAQGYDLALFRLGLLYRDGDLVEQSASRAKECFKAIQSGEGMAVMGAAEELYRTAREDVAAKMPGAAILDR